MFELGMLIFLIFGTQIHVVGQSAPPALPRVQTCFVPPPSCLYTGSQSFRQSLYYQSHCPLCKKNKDKINVKQFWIRNVISRVCWWYPTSKCSFTSHGNEMGKNRKIMEPSNGFVTHCKVAIVISLVPEAVVVPVSNSAQYNPVTFCQVHCSLV